MAPAVMVSLVLVPLWLGKLPLVGSGMPSASFKDIVLLLVVPAAILYGVLALRDSVTRRPLFQIQSHIKNRLLQAYGDDATGSAAAQRLRRGHTLLRVFHHLIDSDESLAATARRLRLSDIVRNGVADGVVVSFFGVLLYLFAFLYYREPSHAALVGVFAALHMLLSMLVLPRMARKHMALLDEQLRHIVVQKRLELCDELRNASTDGDIQ